LIYLSAFPFEGMLGYCGSLIHGTRGFGSQIGKHLGIENYLHFEASSEFSKMNNMQLRTLCSKMKNNKKNDGLLGTIFFSKLRILLSKSDHEFILKNNIDPDSPINIASRACFQNKGIS
jgi:hypothetical protein